MAKNAAQMYKVKLCIDSFHITSHTHIYIYISPIQVTHRSYTLHADHNLRSATRRKKPRTYKKCRTLLQWLTIIISMKVYNYLYLRRHEWNLKKKYVSSQIASGTRRPYARDYDYHGRHTTHVQSPVAISVPSSRSLQLQVPRRRDAPRAARSPNDTTRPDAFSAGPVRARFPSDRLPAKCVCARHHRCCSRRGAAH